MYIAIFLFASVYIEFLSIVDCFLEFQENHSGVIYFPNKNFYEIKKPIIIGRKNSRTIWQIEDRKKESKKH